MKLLFDQNLAPRLVRDLADIFPDSEHVRGLGMARASDRDVWEHAKQGGFVIASKDNDFQQMSFVFDLMTPAMVHYGRAEAIRDQRVEVLQAACAASPERFVRGLLQPLKPPTAAWINPPKTEENAH